MKKFTDLVRPKAGKSSSSNQVFSLGGSRNADLEGADTPEANVSRAIIAFCEAGKGSKQQQQTAPGPEGIDSSNSQIDEVTYLPIIVESAESSPTAAAEACRTIRKQLDSKHHKKAYQQYNALMLLRILVDNPGATFTRNMDGKFVSTVKELYRGSRDPSVRQLLLENLDYFNKKDDPGLQPLKEWFAKEKESQMKSYELTKEIFGRGAVNLKSNVPAMPRPVPGIYAGQSAGQPYSGSSRRRGALPPPEELAARISEAQTSAKLLMQILQSTPTSEILANQLITEFADRCSAASRSIQAFIEADSPGPDESTMLTLFETNEQLATSLSRHQLAVFSAKQQAKQEGGVSRQNSSDQVPQIPPAPLPMTTSPGPIPEPVHEGATVYRTSPGISPSPPVLGRPYQPSPLEPQAPENPFSDPETTNQTNNHTTPYQAWRPQPYEQQQDNLYGQHNISPIAPPPGGERHPMADPSPAANNSMPHGYQPYRY